VNLTLCTRGLRALDAVGIGDAVRRLAVAAHQRIAHTVDGTLLHQPYGNSGEALYSILRGSLSQLLLTCAEREPNVRIHFNQRCLGVDLAAPAVRVEDTVTGQVSVHAAERVIGADGAFSAVRTQMQRLNRFSFSQEYVEQGYRELLCPAELVRGRLERHALHFWPRGHSMLIGQPNLDGSFTLTLHMPFEGEPSFASIAMAEALRAFFEKHFADALPLLPHLVRDYFSRPPTSLITIRCSQWAHQDKVALIGDAAHAIVPFYGQGANFGFEDCLVLDQCLSGHGGDWSAALRAYEQERRPNADAIAELSVAHLAELREKVGDPRFQLRKQIERKINRLYPERFAPLYSLISFSTLPYTTAWRIASEQSMLLDRILNVPDVERRWDGPEVEALIHELMRGMPPGVVLQGAVEWKPQAEPMPGRAR
jgi:kynurenine 3-monooxygenase